MIDITTLDCLTAIQLELQCKYAKLAVKFNQYLKFNICENDLKKNLRILNALISIINKYDNRDILLSTNMYNTITKKELEKLVEKSFNIITSYE